MISDRYNKEKIKYVENGFSFSKCHLVFRLLTKHNALFGLRTKSGQSAVLSAGTSCLVIGQLQRQARTKYIKIKNQKILEKVKEKRKPYECRDVQRYFPHHIRTSFCHMSFFYWSVIFLIKIIYCFYFSIANTVSMR